MITKAELCARMQGLDMKILNQWIEMGLVEPQQDPSGFLFDEIDEARIALVCDLYYRMGLDHGSLPVVLSLVDQLHHTRHSLRAITTAVSEQSAEVRVAITQRTRIVLAGRPGVAKSSG